ncbi:MAG TPA: SRPBCC family protein [Burkholderiales bacterium]|nr:SRPBCC family protein [Burkholderiales bacterium]
MAKVRMETELAVPANILWQSIGSFSALGDWHPAIEKCESDGDRKGSIRKLSLIGGGTIIERLEDVSETEKIYRYSITDSPLPVSNYLSEIKVTDNGDGTSTMEWSGQFDPRNASENDAVKVVRGIYQAGFDNLQKMFSK